MLIKKIIVLFVLPLLLLSCGSNQVRMSEYNEVLETEIVDNGTKFFTYRLIRKFPQDTSETRSLDPNLNGNAGRGNRGSRSGTMRPSGPGMDVSFEAIEAQLELKLAETGYCREGYLELDSSSINGQYAIRGECREGASDNDRRTFNNTQSL